MNHKRVALMVGSLLVMVFAAGPLSAREATAGAEYSTTDREYYLNEEAIAFIRPGLEITILDVTIPSDRRPEVRFMLTDPGEQPLDRDGIVTPGPISTSFVMSYIPEGEEAYVAYTTRVQTSDITGDSQEQGSSDSGGEYTTEAVGTYMYKFGTVLPADYDADATTTLGMYARRDLREFELDRYVDNDLYHFIPSGNGTPEPRDIVRTATCNGRCHDPLALHGGQRQEVGLCVLCHNPTQGIDPDTGNSVYFPVLVHKIHAGAELHNGYQIIGFNNSVHDYSDVEFPGILNECEMCHTGGTPTEDIPMVAEPRTIPVCDRTGRGATTFTWDYAEGGPVSLWLNDPQDGTLLTNNGPQGSHTTGDWVREGMQFFLVDNDSGDTIQEMTMHTTVLGCNGVTPGDFRGEAGREHTEWQVHPNRAACGACHDDVNFATGENHSELNLEMDDDSACHLCHVPDSGREYDRSIRGAHTVEYKSNQLGGVLVQIDRVTNSGPGQRPIVEFWLSNKYGLLDPAELGRLRFAITGPNDDFDFYAQEESLGSLTNIGPGKWSYQFEAQLPGDATGSYSVGVEGRINDVVLNPGTDDEMEVEDQIQNFTFAFAVTDEEPVGRRMVVDGNKCNACHSNLSLHGGNRHNPQYCITCHRPNNNDGSRRPDDALPAETIHFKYLVHKIHRGVELENGYTVYGFSGTPNDLSHFEFPGDLRNCDKCHVNESEQLPLPAGLLETPTPYAFIDPMEPATAACLACHDSVDAAAHAAANTGFLGESCSTCHGEDRAFSVDYVHAR